MNKENKIKIVKKIFSKHYFPWCFGNPEWRSPNSCFFSKSFYKECTICKKAFSKKHKK